VCVVVGENGSTAGCWLAAPVLDNPTNPRGPSPAGGGLCSCLQLSPVPSWSAGLWEMRPFTAVLPAGCFPVKPAAAAPGVCDACLTASLQPRLPPFPAVQILLLHPRLRLARRRSRKEGWSGHTPCFSQCRSTCAWAGQGGPSPAPADCPRCSVTTAEAAMPCRAPRPSSVFA
jgi:hypothetical protein